MISKILELLFSYVLLRGLVLPFVTGLLKKYIFEPIFAWFKKRYVISERELAIWMHYKNKSENTGHNHKRISECDDGLCRII